MLPENLYPSDRPFDRLADRSPGRDDACSVDCRHRERLYGESVITDCLTKLPEKRGLVDIVTIEYAHATPDVISEIDASEPPEAYTGSRSTESGSSPTKYGTSETGSYLS